MTDTATKPTRTDDRSVDEILNQEVVAPSFFLHDEDTWIGATIDRVEKSQGQWGPQLKWIFVLDEEKGQGNGKDGADREEWYFTPTQLSTKDTNKLRKMVKFLTGEFPAEGARPDLRPFVGAAVEIMFERYPATVDGASVEKERIYKVRPSRSAGVPF